MPAKKLFSNRVKYDGPKGSAVGAGIDKVIGKRTIRRKALKTVVPIATGIGLALGGAHGNLKEATIGTIVGGTMGFFMVLPEFKEVKEATGYVGHLMTKELEENPEFKEFLERHRGKYLIIDRKGQIILKSTRNPVGRMRLSIDKILEGSYDEKGKIIKGEKPRVKKPWKTERRKQDKGPAERSSLKRFLFSRNGFANVHTAKESKELEKKVSSRDKYAKVVVHEERQSLGELFDGNKFHLPLDAGLVAEIKSYLNVRETDRLEVSKPIFYALAGTMKWDYYHPVDYSQVEGFLKNLHQGFMNFIFKVSSGGQGIRYFRMNANTNRKLFDKILEEQKESMSSMSRLK